MLEEVQNILDKVRHLRGQGTTGVMWWPLVMMVLCASATNHWKKKQIYSIGPRKMGYPPVNSPGNGNPTSPIGNTSSNDGFSIAMLVLLEGKLSMNWCREFNHEVKNVCFKCVWTWGTTKGFLKKWWKFRPSPWFFPHRETIEKMNGSKHKTFVRNSPWGFGGGSGILWNSQKWTSVNLQNCTQNFNLRAQLDHRMGFVSSIHPLFSISFGQDFIATIHCPVWSLQDDSGDWIRKSIPTKKRNNYS